MGRKVHPIGFRLKINRDWDARWYAEGNRYVDLLAEDRAIRKYIQKEAARALGLSYIGAMRWVIIPQAVRLASPSLMNQMTLFFQSTSLAMTIGVVELTYQTKSIADQTYRIFGVFAVSTVIYLSLSIVLMVAGERLRARNGKEARRNA